MPDTWTHLYGNEHGRWILITGVVGDVGVPPVIDGLISLGSPSDVFTGIYNRLLVLTMDYPKPAIQAQISAVTGAKQQNISRWIDNGAITPTLDSVDWPALVRMWFSLQHVDPSVYWRSREVSRA